MKLSILLVTYNQEKYIIDCIDSIVMQTFSYDYEIIVADDCSDDSTSSIIDHLLKKANMNYVKLESSKNIGFVKNYQKGFKACQGEYVAVMEGDDYWTDPKRIEKHISFLDTHRECSLSFNRIINYIEKSGRYIVPEWNCLEDFEYITTSRMARGNCIGNLSACVFRNSALLKLKQDIFELQIADWMLGMALGRFGLIAHLKEATSVYRINEKGLWNRMTSSKKNQSVIEIIDIYNKYLEFEYNNEFIEYKNRLLALEKGDNLSYSSRVDYLPPIFIFLIKCLIPIKLRSVIKRLIY